MSYKGRVRNGVVILPPEAKLPEGSSVEIIPEEARVEGISKTDAHRAAKRRALDTLYAVFSDSRQPGWDGHGARPASHESYVQAKRFIDALPLDSPAPEIALDPDGDVSLEWHSVPDRTFSVSIGPTGELTYAGKFGIARKTHGMEPFTGEIPDVILDNIHRLLA